MTQARDVFSEDAARCVYCECVLTIRDDGAADRPTDKHRDHLIPRSRNGSDHIENCVVACRGCNLSKRDKTPSEWRPTGLPGWLYEKEKALAAKYRMPSRGRRVVALVAPARAPRIPGYDLLKSRMAVCLEHDRQLCRRPADWEVWSDVDGSWGAHCVRCANYYCTRNRRELDEVRGVMHILVQLRDGTLSRDKETALCALARSGGVSVDEYLDLAVRMLSAEQVVRTRLKEAFPALGLDMWEPKT